MLPKHIFLDHLFSVPVLVVYSHMMFLPSALSSQDKEVEKEYQQPFFFSNYFVKYDKNNENTKNKLQKKLAKKDKIYKGNNLIPFFSDPLLDRDGILKEAEIQEGLFRDALKRKRAELSLALCGKKDDVTRKSLLGNLKLEHKRQITLWGKMQERYTRSMIDYLKQRKEAGKINSSFFAFILDTYHAVPEIQKYRQGLLNQSWAIFFSRWESRPRKQRKWLSQACKKTLKQTDREKVSTVREPKEKLMGPYYLALYRFLRLLPTSERIRLILTETSSKSSVNDD